MDINQPLQVRVLVFCWAIDYSLVVLRLPAGHQQRWKRTPD